MDPPRAWCAVKTARVRADVLLTERCLAPTRTKAQAMILAGEVYVGELRVEKPGDLLTRDAMLSVAKRRRFVSRGGDKLEGALAAFAPDFDDLSECVALDIGASTGGFTDCLLQRRARRVYAVDVGYGQLDARLRSDPRVVVRERTNARSLEPSEFDEPIALVVVDASFIGLGKLLGAVARVLPRGGEMVALIKPQFEVGRATAKRSGGVIRDHGERELAIQHVLAEIRGHALEVTGEVDSALEGPKGNRERFVRARRT